MRIFSLLTLPILCSCAVAGPIGYVDGTTFLASSDEDTPFNVEKVPEVNDHLGHESFGILLNETRGGFEVLPVVENDLLNEAASLHAHDMVENNYLSHISLDGSSVGERVLAVGYDYSFVTENIAQGYSTEESVLNGWMNSPDHRDSILDPRAVDFGLAQVDDTWVLLLGAQSSNSLIAARRSETNF